MDDPVYLLDLVVNDVKTNADRAQVAGDAEICVGGLKVSAGMIVDDDVARSTGLKNGGDGLPVAAGKNLQFHHHLLGVRAADAEDFIAARFTDFLTEQFLNFYGEIIIHDREAL